MLQKTQRVVWIDLAKGATILLIVLHHATAYESALFGNSGTNLVFNWRNFDLLLYHIRLPLFFFISGMAASGFLSGRAARFNWRTARGYTLIYTLWGAALLLLVPSWPNLDVGHAVSLRQIAELGIGQSVVWYLWAIVICLLVAHLTRGLPGWTVVGGAIAIHMLLEARGALPGQMAPLARSLPFYLLGFRYPGLPAQADRLPRGAITALTIVILIVAWRGISAVLLEALLDLIGLGVGLAAARRLPELLPASVAPLTWAGRRTLPIYILHFPIIAAAGEASVTWLGPLTPSDPLVIVYAPALAAGSVAASLLLHRLLLNVGAGWLFKLSGSRTCLQEAAKAP